MITQSKNRRQFLSTSSRTVVGLWGGLAGLKAQGANGDVRLGIIGIRQRGAGLMKQIIEGQGARLVALCDCDAMVLKQRVDDCAKKDIPVAAYADFRKLLESSEIDAVCIATPNHTHTLIATEAMKAGKHVYVEKPVSHNLWEGRQLVHAAEKYQRVCFHGQQRRSNEGWAEMIAWAQSKECELGKLQLVRGLCYKTRQTIGKVTQATVVPASVDYNLWSGPREQLPVMRTQFHYDWHWQWDWGNGDIGNQGPHQFDVARWALGDPALSPTGVMSLGGRYGYDDDGQTPNTQIAFLDFKPVPMIFEVRGLPRQDMNFGLGDSLYQQTSIGNVFHFEGGLTHEGVVRDLEGKVVRKFRIAESGKHIQNFINALKAGSTPAIHNALTGHLTASMPQLCNISYRLGQQKSSDEVQERLKDNPRFAETFERFQQHLTENKLNLAGLKYQVGPWLNFDPTAEQFTGEYAAEANALIKDTYRSEFEIKV